LGGNRISAAITYRNMMVTMMLGGLWHGAAWTFVLWGLWHGVALASERFLRTHFSMPPPALLTWLATSLIVLVGWVLFRSGDLQTATTVLTRMITMASGIAWYPPLVLAAIVCLVAEHLAWRTKLRRAMRLPVTAWYSPIATAIMIWALVLYAPRGFRPFVYFQF
jgi:alginate O-acetyltransferase complex protein AlgI